MFGLVTRAELSKYKDNHYTYGKVVAKYSKESSIVQLQKLFENTYSFDTISRQDSELFFYKIPEAW